MSKSTSPAPVAPASDPAPKAVAIATPVYLLVKPGFNPKAPNSRSAARFALYASNPTVEGYIEESSREAELEEKQLSGAH